MKTVLSSFRSCLLLMTGLLLLAVPARAVDIITATITVTNPAYITNNVSFVTINAGTRKWTNSVSTTSSHVLTNETIGGCATNLFASLSRVPVANAALSRSGTNGVILTSYPGAALAVTLSPDWGSVTLETNPLTSATAVRVPPTVENATARSNILSGLVDYLNGGTTNRFAVSANAFEDLVTYFKQYPQTNAGIYVGTNFFSGPTTLSNTAQSFIGGTVSNVAIYANAGGITNVTGVNLTINSGTFSGNGGRFTNGYWTNGIFHSPTLTNGVNLGAAFSSPRTNVSNSEQFGSGSSASGNNSLAVGFSADAQGESDVAIGYLAAATDGGSVAIGANATTIGGNGVAIGADTTATANSSVAIGETANAAHINSVALGAGSATTASNQIALGSSTVNHVYTPGRIEAVQGLTNSLMTGTNNWRGDLAFERLNVTSLANGNNAAVDPLTNVYIKVSGPSAAFAINGITKGRNGRKLEIQNSTGYNMTIANDSGIDPVAANRIYTGTGADVTFTNNPTKIELTYDSAVSRWILDTVIGSSVAGVSSVALTVPTGLSVSGSPVTGSGTLAISTALNGIVKGNGSAFGTVTIGSGLSYDGTTLSASSVLTPWTSDINAATYNLTNVTEVSLNKAGLPTSAVKLNGVKVYRANFSASAGTPTATVFENTLGGTVVLSQNATGDYHATLSSAFPSGKVFIPGGRGVVVVAGVPVFVKVSRSSDNVVQILTTYGDETATSDEITDFPIYIMVNP